VTIKELYSALFVGIQDAFEVSLNSLRSGVGATKLLIKKLNNRLKILLLIVSFLASAKLFHSFEVDSHARFDHCQSGQIRQSGHL